MTPAFFHCNFRPTILLIPKLRCHHLPRSFRFCSPFSSASLPPGSVLPNRCKLVLWCLRLRRGSWITWRFRWTPTFIRHASAASAWEYVHNDSTSCCFLHFFLRRLSRSLPVIRADQLSREWPVGAVLSVDSSFGRSSFRQAS